MSLGTVKVPTLAQLSEVAAELGLSFSEADLAAHLEALRPSFEGYNWARLTMPWRPAITS
jgi:hypothetical protein